MRWQQLFADLEAQFEQAAERAEQAESGSRTRAEAAATTLAGRLAGSVGAVVVLRTRGAGALGGKLVGAGPGWLLLDDGSGREVLVAAAALLSVSGLGRRTAPPDDGAPRVRTDLRRALRGLVRDRSVVALTLDDGSVLTGTFDRLGADFVELAEHPADEYRRAAAVRSVQTVPLPAVAAIARLGDGPAG